MCETYLQQFQSWSQGIGAEGCIVEVCCCHNSKGVWEMHVVHKGFRWQDIWVSCKLEVIIWKLWYYSFYGTIVVQTRLYGSLFIAITDYVQVDISNIDCMKVVIVEWLLWYAQNTQ